MATRSPTALPKLEHPSVEERAARGKTVRKATPRTSHAKLPPADRDPVEILEHQAATRAPELVPIRYGRMLSSPFAFFRGGAAIMAADLAVTPTTGIGVQLCGDAHLSNFGIFAAPDRELVFDVNDFDETLPGSWEWDVKRLVASVEIAARQRGFSGRQRRGCVLAAVREYREAMRGFAALSNLDVWYARLSVPVLRELLGSEMSEKEATSFDRNVSRARAKDNMRAFAKLTHRVDGEPRILADPPLIVPFEDLLPEQDARTFEARIRELLRAYRSTLRGHFRHLLEGYRFVHMAHKVVGVGSVGTRAWIVLLLGRDDEDPLFLQVKEAQASVLEPFTRASRYANHGRRVVEGQWLMQAASDSFLGWISATGVDDRRRDFYVRQLWDCKRSIDVERLSPSGLVAYARVCGWTLARAHARSGDRIAIASYLGGGDVFDRAIVDFAAAYADRNEQDFAALAAAAEQGRIPVEYGI